jgi:UDP-N-acetylmuramyl pentapeptide phosphotransferase/UDP-N-acetylglucosamine-1-phosphate transferase
VIVIVAVLTGFFAGRLLWLTMRKSWNRQALMRQNYQGVSLPTCAGIVLTLALLLVEAARSVFASIGIGDDPGLTSLRAAAFVVVLAFTVLGLLDDLVGTTGARGFNGHFQALARGELTSGMIKLLGGGAAALVGASLIGSPGFGTLIIDALIIALTANLFNLLDVRPGRTIKAGIGLFGVLAIFTWFNTDLVPTAIVLGAAAALLLDDLHERLMLGDTGANALGAALGLGLATQVDGTSQIIALAVLMGLNVLSEFVSFSKLIDTVPPLRIIDQLGRRRPPVIDLREDVLDADPVAPFEEPFRPTSPATPPMRRTPAERGNVGGAPNGDHAEDVRHVEPGIPEGPSDLFGVSEDDFLAEEELAQHELDDRDFDQPVRHHDHRNN